MYFKGLAMVGTVFCIDIATILNYSKPYCINGDSVLLFSVCHGTQSPASH